MLIGEIPVEAALQQSPHSDRLFCMPATIDLAGAEIELVSMVAREGRLRNCAGRVEEPRLRLRLHRLPAVARAADDQRSGRRAGGADPDPVRVLRARGVGQLLRNIEMVKAHLNPALNVSTVILTMYDGRTKLADQVAEDVRAHFGDKVLRTVIPRSVKVSEAPGYGMTILDYDPGSRGAMSYLDASRETRGTTMSACAKSRRPMSANR